MRWFFLILAIASSAIALALGPRGTKFSSPPFMLFPDMDNQQIVKPQKPSEFFENGQGARKPVEGTVPLGLEFPTGKSAPTTPLDFSRGDSYYDTGRFGDYFGKGFPEEVKVDGAFLERGKQRFAITCSPCHGTSGNGHGAVSKYWLLPPTANLLDARVKKMPEGQIFSTITHGQGLMGPYNGILAVKDRWAIIAYLRALQNASGK